MVLTVLLTSTLVSAEVMATHTSSRESIATQGRNHRVEPLPVVAMTALYAGKAGRVPCEPPRWQRARDLVVD
jgi:hypothetical protein